MAQKKTDKPKIINMRDLFNLPDEDDNLANSNIKEAEISRLKPFGNHPFRLYEGERLDDMVESIKEHGILMPLIVRPVIIDLEDKDVGKYDYEILSGHNRANAAVLAGLEKVPIIVKEGLTDEEAMLVVTETNLIQRSFAELSHSEKAKILTVRHKAIKEQGQKTDLIKEIESLSNIDGDWAGDQVGQFGPLGETRERISEKYDLSPEMFHDIYG
ncbi:MAG: ParB N-terminal domain-containing protein [Firmicutes bacterium]|nr:ParB N-terminal domain-containing protein [Bacillota bacterium]